MLYENREAIFATTMDGRCNNNNALKENTFVNKNCNNKNTLVKKKLHPEDVIDTSNVSTIHSAASAAWTYHAKFEQTMVTMKDDDDNGAKEKEGEQDFKDESKFTAKVNNIIDMKIGDDLNTYITQCYAKSIHDPNNKKVAITL